MKDRLLLVLVAAGSAVVAWAFWHFMGADALNALLIIALISVIADNLRLRRQLRVSR